MRARCRMAKSISLVVVLPLEPVTARTLGAVLWRWKRAMSPSARRVSRTRITDTRSGPATFRCTTMQPPPRRAASGTNT